MKTLITTGVVFTPSSRSLDFSAISGFDPSRLYGVINATAGSKIYAPGITGFGYHAYANGVLSLETDTTAMASTDILLIAYESSASQKVDGSGVTQPVSALALPLPLGAAKDASLQDILAAIRAQRFETIWTDDTGARFIRLDNGGTISWTDIAGNASAAPGTGVRPDSDSGTVVSRYTYLASAAGTGYVSGDLLDHIIVVDGDAGDLVSNFWVNITQGTKIAGPTNGTFSPVDQGTDPASPVVANQGTGTRGWLATIAGLLKRGATNIAGALSFAPATDVSNLEPAGVKATAATMQAGGVGLTGWLSSLWIALIQRSTYFQPFTAFATSANGTAAVGAAMSVGASPSPWAKARAICTATATGGTFALQGSNDGFVASFFYLAQASVTTASVPIPLEAPACMTGVRLVYTPGANAAIITASQSLHVA